MSSTASQLEAIRAQGNVLVVAGAGAGKTSTLVERCLDRLLHPATPVQMDEILMVTFTEAAATEMKARIRKRLSEELAARAPGKQRTFLEEQLALLETAHIGTLHSFCLQLIRQHFHELALDPQLTVLDQEQAGLMMEEVLDGMLERLYAGSAPSSAGVQELIEVQAQGQEKLIRELVLKLHHYTQTLPDPAGWLRNQRAHYRQSRPAEWLDWLLEGLRFWRDLWLPVLHLQPRENLRAHAFADRLLAWSVTPARHEAAQLLDEIVAADRDWPRGTKEKFRGPLAGFFEEAAFLHSLATVGEGADPLEEDWQWVRLQMETLLSLVEEFARAFAKAKREQGVVDFHDFEQFALQLLWDTATDRPRPLAQEWRRIFHLVFVDEYQDINAAQDAILRALSREGAEANRFLVGDVKQSIYRFRLAAPHIFQNYKAAWESSPGHGKVVPLTDNFRSRERLLQFINPIFTELMRREIGGVAYEREAELQFGARDVRHPLSAAAAPEPCVEIHLRLTGAPTTADREETGLPEAAEWTDAEQEARLVARRLRELRASQQTIWDEAEGQFRPVDWRDMVVLLRSPAAKAEAYAKEFARLGVPLQAARGGFYENTEITDLLSLLLLLDNPLQDVPLLAVLRSPLVGLSLNELAEIRLAERKVHFWTALVRWHTVQDKKTKVDGAPPAPPSRAPSTGEKVRAFLARFARWRRMARETSLSQRLETVLNETHYLEWLLTLDRGEQRRANVRRLLALAQRFDPFQRQGLPRFLRFVDAQKAAEVESEPAAVEAGNTVRLTSIHRSKGLEFPVVVLADLGKNFNFRDLRDAVVLDEKYGLCPQIKPPQTAGHYPSLPYWLARWHQRQETLGEELRLLYVALTRARDRLILVGTTSEKTPANKWGGTPGNLPSTKQILSATTYLDWLGPWWTRQINDGDWAARSTGRTDLFQWTIHAGEESAQDQEPLPPEARAVLDFDPSGLEPDPIALQQLTRRLEWRYEFSAATREPAKTAVTVLRHRREEVSEDEAQQWFAFSAESSSSVAPGARLGGALCPRESDLSAAQVGTAHHLFLEMVSMENLDGPLELRNEAERLRIEGALAPEQFAALDLEALNRFWQSDVGRRIRGHAGHVHREVPFTARFSPADLADLKLSVGLDLPDEEFFVVQGAVDLAVILPQEIWILDFKTDQLSPGQLPEKVGAYAPQIKVYGMALSRIFRRPVKALWLHFLSLGETVAV